MLYRVQRSGWESSILRIMSTVVPDANNSNIPLRSSCYIWQTTSLRLYILLMNFVDENCKYCRFNLCWPANFRLIWTCCPSKHSLENFSARHVTLNLLQHLQQRVTVVSTYRFDNFEILLYPQQVVLISNELVRYLNWYNVFLIWSRALTLKTIILIQQHV